MCAGILSIATLSLYKPWLDAWRVCGRFVRETGFRTIEAMCAVCAGPPLHDIGQEVAERLADGLSDSWSHVRCYPFRA